MAIGSWMAESLLPISAGLFHDLERCAANPAPGFQTRQEEVVVKHSPLRSQSVQHFRDIECRLAGDGGKVSRDAGVFCRKDIETPKSA